MHGLRIAIESHEADVLTKRCRFRLDLFFVFLRKRKVALVVSGLSCILALGGLGFPFHPSFPGLVLLLGSAAALYLTVRWQYKKYPYLSFKHAHTLFEGEEVCLRRTHALRLKHEN